jgi:hypothetical protein
VCSLRHQVWSSISHSVINAALRRIARQSLLVVSKPACSQSGQVYSNPLGGQLGCRRVSFCFPLPLEVVFIRREGSTVGGDGVRRGGEE